MRTWKRSSKQPSKAMTNKKRRDKKARSEWLAKKMKTRVRTRGNGHNLECRRFPPSVGNVGRSVMLS